MYGLKKIKQSFAPSRFVHWKFFVIATKTGVHKIAKNQSAILHYIAYNHRIGRWFELNVDYLQKLLSFYDVVYNASDYRLVAKVKITSFWLFLVLFRGRLN